MHPNMVARREQERQRRQDKQMMIETLRQIIQSEDLPATERFEAVKLLHELQK